MPGELPGQRQAAAAHTEGMLGPIERIVREKRSCWQGNPKPSL
ncbi:hypothetical protein RISK_006692 [Rhodopirellula islandica]|uniref:Uncharacterized protein n=1 Tax=Rhodopirellula islandica TaxID=595434 RepID=A0A0J1B3D1_RHOIS|nr:hypothetical protein RISK_006692 [Rhodopirellula islandica]